jgi:hypothetical protein
MAYSLVNNGHVKVTSAPISKSTAYNRLCILTILTAVIHAVSCIVIFTTMLVKMGSGGPTFGRAYVGRIASCWNDLQPNSNSIIPGIAFGSITNNMDIDSGWDRHYTIAFLLTAFFFLSAVFQFMSLFREKHWDDIVGNQPQWYRYTEYSISAGCMIVATFISFGMLDSYLHVCVFMLTSLCMVIGLMADYTRSLDTDTDTDDDTSKNIRFIALILHYIAWPPILVVWGILWIVVIDMGLGRDACNNPNGSELPTWVWAVLVTQFFLFNSFGYVQRMQLSNQFDINYFSYSCHTIHYNQSFLSRRTDYDAITTGIETESCFLILSVISKTILGWIVYTNVLIS